ncbi:MAG: PAS domain S-box protein [Jatrophihabitantaceae bacterium]
MAGSWHGWWARVTRDPYTVLLAAAVALQITLGSSSAQVVHPGWAVAGLVVFVAACASALAGRLRPAQVPQSVPPFALVIVAACWRAADDPDVSGFGGLCVIAVIWLGFYGTRRQVWSAVIGSVLAMIVPPLFVGEAVGADDWRRAVLTGAVALLVGPSINSVVQRGAQSARQVTALEPVGTRLAAVLRAATGNMIVACDPDGTIVEFNQGAERLLGYRADEVVGKHTPLLFHDPDETLARGRELGLEPGLEAYHHAALRDEVEIRDWTYLTKDGRRIVVSMSVTCMRDAAGRVTGFVGIGTDVTASRATIQTLASQREIYRLLVEHLPETTVGLLDADLRCVTLGGHWLKRLGGDPGRFTGTRVDELFDRDDRAGMLEFYRRAQHETVSTQRRLANGRTYELHAVPLEGSDGVPLVLCLSRDVTAREDAAAERQRTNAALAVSEATFREAFEGAPIGMALTTVEDGPGERFLRVNPAFAAILGRTPDELVGHLVAGVTHPEDVALKPELHPDAATPPLRKRFLRPTGRAVWVEISYAVVRDENGAPLHVIKQIQDVHAIKESERALLDALDQQRAATARLRELDRIRTDLVGTISHELRTPLTSIHGYLALLREEQLTDPQHGMLDVAVRNTDRLADLVDNLLVLVRLDSVESAAATSDDEVDLAVAVSAAIDTVRPAVVDRDQHVEVNLPVERTVVRGDFDQIDRVLVNLLSNASKYTPPGGRIDVDIAMTGARQVRIAIADSGIGIPPEDLPHLFTRFFRASTARANSISGNGLGLAIVKSIVERHGGEVSVVSAPGSGSRFTVTLPLAVRAAARMPQSRQSVTGR